MKKIALLLVLVLLVSAFSVTAAASDLGISMIGGDNEFQAQDFDNMQIGVDYEVPGYASFKLDSFGFYDYFAEYNKDCAGDNNSTYKVDRTEGTNPFIMVSEWNYHHYYSNAVFQDSGANAEFAWLMMDITNLQKEEVLFSKEITIKVVYDDEYEYAGWLRQFDKNYATIATRVAAPEGRGWWTPDPNRNVGLFALNPANEESIGMVFTGTYAIGCTLPNAVVESERPLKMIVTVGDCELTYIIRK